MNNIRRPEFVALLLALLLAGISGGQPLTDALEGGGIMAALGGSMEAARLTRLLLALPIFGGLAYVLLTNRALVMPKIGVQIALAVLFVSLALAIPVSPFPYASLDSWLSWLLMGASMLLAASASGRKTGPVIVLAVIAVAAAVAGIKGIREYGDMRAIDPNWRIFAGWSNPNAAASLFALAIPVGFGVSAAAKGSALRVAGLISSGISLCALLLTQSKGGILAAGLGAVAFFVVFLLWKASPKRLAFPLASVGLGAILFAGLVFAPKPQSAAPGGTAMGRLASTGTEAEQSAGFRTLLWKTSIELVKERPLGWGPGVFRFVSGKPGLVTQTVTTHQAYLQAAVEGGLLAMAAFISLGLLWIHRAFQAPKSLTEDQNILRAACVAGVIAAGAHGVVESNLAYLGFGILLFAVMGVGLQLSADGSSPELTPKGLRQILAVLTCVAPLLLVALVARGESAKTSLLNAVQTGSPEVKELAQGVRSASANDGEASFLYAMYGASSDEERSAALKEAAATHPSTRVLRALARNESAQGRYTEAVTALDRAIDLDPNNLPALWLKVQTLESSGNQEQAIQAAHALIEKEKSSSFTTRSLAESVPTETYRARLWLLEKTPDAKERQELASAAVAGMSEFARLTVPQIARMGEGGQRYAGINPAEAKEWLQDAKEAAKRLKTDPKLADQIKLIDQGLERLSSLDKM